VLATTRNIRVALSKVKGHFSGGQAGDTIADFRVNVLARGDAAIDFIGIFRSRIKSILFQFQTSPFSTLLGKGKTYARAFHLSIHATSISLPRSFFLSLSLRCEKYCLNCLSGNFVGSLTREPSRFIIHITHTNLSVNHAQSHTSFARSSRSK